MTSAWQGLAPTDVAVDMARAAAGCANNGLGWQHPGPPRGPPARGPPARGPPASLASSSAPDERVAHRDHMSRDVLAHNAPGHFVRPPQVRPVAGRD